MRAVPLFDEESHTYTLDGIEYPSVTTVLGILDTYKNVPLGHMEVARDRGQAVHLALDLYDRGVLDWNTVDEALHGSILGWETFKQETGAVVLASEFPVVSTRWRYAGTPDRLLRMVARFPGFKQPVCRNVLADIKRTATLVPTVGPQTAAYLEAYNEGAPARERVEYRLVVLLKDDGTYRMELLTDRTDLTVFRSCLTVHQWRTKHGYA